MDSVSPFTRLDPSDLFVVLERAFRRKSRNCLKCGFSLPYRVFQKGTDEGRWAVIPSSACSTNCREILEDLVAEFQHTYRLPSSSSPSPAR